MSVLTTTELPRKFFLVKGNDKVELDDITGLDAKDVIKLYSGTYPELVSVDISQPEITPNGIIYNLKPRTGNKG